MPRKKTKGKPSASRGPAKNMRRDREIESTAKREFSADARERRDCYRSKENDPAWYAQNPQLMRDYASFPFGQPVGMPLKIGTGNAAVPGIMAYYFTPALGNASNPNAAVNIAARNIYSFVRHANSGHSNYDAPDLMIYLLAMDSVYMMHAFMKRVLGVVLDYSPLNRYYPAALIRAMGLDPDDVAQHTQDLRGFINTYAVKMGSMCVPNSMSYMARHSWMCEGLYTDSSAAKAQTYMYVPSGFYKFTLSGSPAVGSLTKQPWMYPQLGSSLTNSLYYPKKLSVLMELANELLDAILVQEDFNIMSGDILKAFGPEGVVKVMGVADGYMVLPQYNQEVLSQFENATILNGQWTGTVKQATDVGTGYLIEQAQAQFEVPIPASASFTGSPTYSSTSSTFRGFTNKKILNFHHDSVTPEEVMVATRLAFNCTPLKTDWTHPEGNPNWVTGVQLSGFGSEIVEYAVMCTYSYSTSGALTYNWDPIGTAFASCVLTTKRRISPTPLLTCSRRCSA